MKFLEIIFRRPGSSVQHADYSNHLTVATQADEEALTAEGRKTLRRILAALYGYPKDKVLSGAIDSSSQLVFALWAQQWPRLRRNFRFCTACPASLWLMCCPKRSAKLPEVRVGAVFDRTMAAKSPFGLKKA
jgi:hypothetical protein